MTNIKSIALGQAGVYRVLAELVMRGHKPYLPAVDTGVDVMLHTGLRLQIKTTNHPSKHWRLSAGTYSFSLAKARIIRRGGVTKQEARTFTDHCDLVLLVAMEANRFWIVPAPVLNGRHTVTIAEGAPQWRPCDVEAAKALRADGLSYQAIAERLGTDYGTVRRRLGRGFETPKKNYSNLQQYEGRWDLLDSYARLNREANQIIESVPSASDRKDMRGVSA